ncbi:MAG TPA: ferredoxin-NADPH reductase [Candidatus Lumbricidophila sp.]|nr:ferredoxin-NADPH reductase [Candidatus Lumbricidophila sp.]
MARNSYEVANAAFAIASLILTTNLMLAITSLPLLVLAMTTDPTMTWPLIAVAAVISAPGIPAAYRVFLEHRAGGTGPVRAFARGYRATWRKTLLVALIVVAVLVVLYVDVHAVARLSFAVVVVPLLWMLAILSLAAGMLIFVALAEDPKARVRRLVRAALVLSVRRWYLTVVSLLLGVVQIALFTNIPALAIGVTASAVLYLVWANSRYTLRPILPAAQNAAGSPTDSQGLL